MKHGKRTRSTNVGQKRIQRFSVARFVATYVLLMGGLALAMSLEPIKRVIDINGLYTDLIVKATAMVLKPFGFVKGVRGSIIHLKGISLDVKFGCNGLEAFLIYMVAILAFPAHWKKKLWGILVGFFVIQILNVARIVALGYCGVHFASFFHVFHIYVAQGIMIAIAFVLFLFWLSNVVKE